MAISINNNVASLNAQRNSQRFRRQPRQVHAASLKWSSDQLCQDDAAGLAISTG